MVSNDSTTPGRHTARKQAARELAGRTGMTYTEALRHVSDTGVQRIPRYRWVLTDGVRRFFAGDGWRNVQIENLYDWLDGLDPIYECDWCGEPGDAREVDSSIRLVVAAHNPDLSPVTGILFSSTHHATCTPSMISWAAPVDVPRGPHRIALPSSVKPEIVGEFAITAAAVVCADDEDSDAEPYAALVLTSQVLEDHGQGAVPWLNELGLALTANGFGHPDSLITNYENDWALRIATDYPSSLAPPWIALRTGPAEDATAPPHFYLGALDLPANWIELARHHGQVLLRVGPFPQAGELVELPGQLDAADLDALVDDGVFLVGWVQVTADNE